MNICNLTINPRTEANILLPQMPQLLRLYTQHLHSPNYTPFNLEMEAFGDAGHRHAVANAIVSVTGVLYFAAWSISFYPQVILNFQRKRTTGLSPDYVYINPLGFLALTIWSWGVYYNPLAKQQYRDRHDGHSAQVSKSDLAFSLHALVISLITLVQVWYYGSRGPRRRRSKSIASDMTDESEPLISRTISKDDLIPLDPVIPSKPTQLGIYVLAIGAFVSAIMVWARKIQLLDWLYVMSSYKLVISLIKYIPQVILNWRLRSVEGFAIGNIVLVSSWIK